MPKKSGTRTKILPFPCPKKAVPVPKFYPSRAQNLNNINRVLALVLENEALEIDFLTDRNRTIEEGVLLIMCRFSSYISVPVSSRGKGTKGGHLPIQRKFFAPILPPQTYNESVYKICVS